MEELNIKLVTCRGKLKEGLELNWFNNTKKILYSEDDFIFIIKADEFFPDMFKYIQDNNNLEYLKIQEIKNGRNIF